MSGRSKPYAEKTPEQKARIRFLRWQRYHNDSEYRRKFLDQQKQSYAKNKRQLEYHYENREKILLALKQKRLSNLKKARERDRRNYLENRAKELLSSKNYRQANLAKVRLQGRLNYQKNRLVILQRQKERNATAEGRLYLMARNTAKRLVDLGGKKPCRSLVLLGTDLRTARLFIESQFKKGMTWENYGRTGWHIDHKRPLDSFDLTKEEEFRKAVHYTNLQPLWWYENLSKGSKFEDIICEPTLVAS